jgi:hypothetical protein
MLMGARGLLLRTVLVAGTTMSTSASADEPTAPVEAAERTPLRLDVLVSERGPQHPWHLRVENVSDEPLRVVADPRLMRFVVEVPGAKNPVECELPDAMIPAGPVDEAIVLLEPGRQVVRRFDPRFFCFTTGEQKTLVPGAVVTPTFGWATPTKTVWKKGKRVEEPLAEGPPWVAEPVREGSLLAPIKNAPAGPVTLGPDYAAWVDPEDEDSKEPFAVGITGGVDAHDERAIIINLELRNRSKQKQRIFFRRELVTYEVLGPEGLMECRPEPDARNPTPAAFSTLGAGASSRFASRLVELCPRGTFGRPGLYLVNARLEAEVSGEEYNMQTFTGVVRTPRPVSVRVRTGEDPFLIGPPKKKKPPPEKAKGPTKRATDGKPTPGPDQPKKKNDGSESAPPDRGEPKKKGTELPPPKPRRPQRAPDLPS